LRVGEALRHSLAELFLRVEIDDDRLRGVHVTVSEVRASADLRQATAFVTPLGGERKDEVVEALNRHARFLRGELSPKVTLKYMPELKFELDTSYDEYAKINELLHSPKVARDLD
jgi:ribosome-binding factor A